MSGPHRYLLHGYWRSSATYRVRIGLQLKGLPYEIAPVNLLEGQHKADAHAARNPMRQVPVLEVEDGGVHELAQSLAILEYLEERHPEPPLLPRDRVGRARARQLFEIVASGIQPLQNLTVTKRLDALGVDSKAWSVELIGEGLAAYEALARKTAGRYSYGDAPGLADCALVPQLYNARRFGIDVGAQFPLLARIDAACAELDAFRAAHPDRQPDAPRGA